MFHFLTFQVIFSFAHIGNTIALYINTFSYTSPTFFYYQSIINTVAAVVFTAMALNMFVLFHTSFIKYGALVNTAISDLNNKKKRPKAVAITNKKPRSMASGGSGAGGSSNKGLGDDDGGAGKNSIMIRRSV